MLLEEKRWDALVSYYIETTSCRLTKKKRFFPPDEKWCHSWAKNSFGQRENELSTFLMQALWVNVTWGQAGFSQKGCCRAFLYSPPFYFDLKFSAFICICLILRHVCFFWNKIIIMIMWILKNEIKYGPLKYPSNSTKNNIFVNK